MTAHLHRQLADYAEYHRDQRNCTLHVFGIVFLFLAAVLPLSLWPITAFGVRPTMAIVMVLPVLGYWILLDAVLGLAIAGAAVLLLAAAAMIVNHVAAAGVWSITAVLIVVGLTLQVVGHQLFERRRPALLDNPAHLLLGPMFVMAKLFIALGFRRDLAAVVHSCPPRVPPLGEERQREPRTHS